MSVVILAIAAATAFPLEPVGGWKLQAEDAYCAASRDFAGGARQITVGFKPFTGAETTDLTFISPLTGQKETSGVANLVIGFGEKPITARYSTRPNASATAQITILRITDAVADRLLGGTTFTASAGAFTATVHMPNSTKASAALKDCQADLLKSWASAPQPIAPATAPKLSPGQLQRLFGAPENYPDEARKAGAEGLVEVVVVISATGRAEQCIVLRSPAQSLSAATCSFSRALQFAAATDAGGKPVAGRYTLRITWALPS